MHADMWQETLKERNYLEELRLDGRVILKWILKRDRMEGPRMG